MLYSSTVPIVVKSIRPIFYGTDFVILRISLVGEYVRANVMWTFCVFSQFEFAGRAFMWVQVCLVYLYQLLMCQFQTPTSTVFFSAVITNSLQHLVALLYTQSECNHSQPGPLHVRVILNVV
jgi:hypothetical protein